MRLPWGGGGAPETKVRQGRRRGRPERARPVGRRNKCFTLPSIRNGASSYLHDRTLGSLPVADQYEGRPVVRVRIRGLRRRPEAQMY